MAEKIRPPRNVFKRLSNNLKEMPKKIKKNITTYYLLYFLIICISTFFLEKYKPVIYEKYLFNVLVQLSFFGLFLKDLITLKLCVRNKIIIYTLLIYFLGNTILPFFIKNELYIDIYSNVFNTLFIILSSYTLFNSNIPKNEVK